MPPTPWPLRYATSIPPRHFYCRRNPALEVWVESAAKHGMGCCSRSGLPAHRRPPLLTPGNAAQAQIRFIYENPKLQPPKYVLTVKRGW